MKKLLAFIVAAILCLSCFAACGKKNEAPQNNESTPTQVVYDVEDAAAYLKNMYKKYLVETETAADFTLVSQVMKGGVVYKVTWTTDREDIKVIADEENKQVKIDLNEKTKVDITYKLTATITDPDGKTATLTFELKVPKYVLSTWDEYMAMEAGKAVVVEGYIAAVHAPSEGNKYNTLYLHDVNNKGGYYVYSMASDKDLVKDLGLKKGMLVSVTGTKDIYSGTHEIKDASVNVLDTTVVDFKPLDITATYKAATTLKDKALTDKLGMLVTIKGVEITDQDLSEKSQYLNFKLAGLTTYLRVYATDCPVSVTDAGQKSIIEEHGKKKGYEADVTGVVVMYSGAIYLNPVSDTPFAYGKKIERTPEQMVEVEMDEVKFDKDITLDKTLTLPTKGNTYEDVKITWASNSEAIVIDGDKAKIKLQDEATTASITATFTLGTISKTKTFEFNLSKKSSIVPQNAANPVPGVAYKFFYTQTQLGEYRYFDGTTGGYYGNTTAVVNEAVDVYLETATDGYYLYFMNEGTKTYIEAYMSGTYCNLKVTTDTPASVFKLDAALDNAPVVTLGTETYFLGSYDNRTDFRPSKYSYAASGNYVAHLGTVVDINSLTPEQKIDIEKNGLTVESDEFFKDAEMSLALEGSIHSDVKITWASNNAAAVVDGGKLKVTLVDEAQTVTLTATLTCGTATATKEFTIELKAKGYNLTSIADANVIGAAKGHNEYTTETHFVAGVITKIADTTYGNCYINDEFGNSIYIYGLKDSTGALRYDALAVKPQVGDYIIVASVIGKYNSTVQLKNAQIMEHIAATSITEANTIGAAQPDKGAATTDKYLVTGEITTAPDSQYGNCTIKDTEGNTLTVYGMYNSTGETRYDALTTKPQAGDTVTLYGVLSNYNGPQIKNAWLYSYVAGTPSGGNEGGNEGQMTITSIVDAIAIGAAKGHNEYTTENHYVAGVITEIVSTKYGNTYITDEFGNTIYTYGLYDSTGDTRYDSMTVKPQVGDYIVVSAPIGKYNDVIQLKNPKLVEHIAATSITEANTIGAAQPDKGAATTDKYLVTGEITTAPDSRYGNCTIKDTEGNTLTVYGMYNSTGETRYDALTTKPQAGDTVTLYGVLSNYNGPQIKNAWLYGYVAGTPSGGNEGGNEGGAGGSTPAPTGKTYHFVATYNNEKYYLTTTLNSGKGTTTKNESEAAVFYMETSGSNYRFYYLDGSSKVYLTLKNPNSSKTSALAYVAGTPCDLVATTVANVTVYKLEASGRAMAFYTTNKDIRTYATSDASNFNGTSGIAVVLEEIA